MVKYFPCPSSDLWETCPSSSDGPGKKKMVGEKAYSALLSFLALAFSSSVAHADDHHGRGHVGGGSRDSGKGHNRVKQYLEELSYKYLTGAVGRRPIVSLNTNSWLCFSYLFEARICKKRGKIGISLWQDSTTAR